MQLGRLLALGGEVVRPGLLEAEIEVDWEFNYVQVLHLVEFRLLWLLFDWVIYLLRKLLSLNNWNLGRLKRNSLKSLFFRFVD